MKTKIFIIDDDTSFCNDLQAFLQNLHYEVQVANTLAQAQQMAPAFYPDILLLDLQLPDGNGLDFLPFAQEHLPGTPVVILSGYGSISTAVQAVKNGAEDFLSKPIDPEHLKIFLQKLIERRQIKNRLRLQELENKGEWFLGPSTAMKQLLELAQTAAQSDATILIQGETGTGKQLLARFIHEHSPRAHAPFVYVNCATLNETLIESDLFGHEKGAFTGAMKQKPGRVELAHGGTLFLDEIGELPLSLQAKLLHFVEYGQFQRVGGTTMLKANVRIICATNRELPEMVQQKTFREDLFFRLNVIQLAIPPLRERPEDILPFVEFFLQKFSTELNKPKVQLTETVKQQLQSYPWPGNVRELRNAIERAVILATRSQLTENDFPFLKLTPTTSPDDLLAPRPLNQALNEFKTRFIQRVLEFTNGNQTQAAKILQIQRTYLNKLLHEKPS